MMGTAFAAVFATFAADGVADGSRNDQRGPPEWAVGCQQAKSDGVFEPADPRDERLRRVVALVDQRYLVERGGGPSRWNALTLEQRRGGQFCRPFDAFESEPAPAACVGIALEADLVAFPGHCRMWVSNLAEFRIVRRLVLEDEKLPDPPDARRFVSCFDPPGDADLLLCRVDKPWDDLGSRSRPAKRVERKKVEMFGHPWGLTLKRIVGKRRGKRVVIANYDSASGSPMFVGNRFIGLFLGAGPVFDRTNVPCQAENPCLTADRCTREPVKYLPASKIRAARKKLKPSMMTPVRASGDPSEMPTPTIEKCKN